MKKAAVIEPYRVFRDALETQKPAYLGKFNNSHDAEVQGTFYAMALHIYNVIEKLFKQVCNLNHDAKVSALCKHLPTSLPIAYQSIANLNWSVHNWFHKNEIITEELNDTCFENTTCAICNFTGEAVFYFSTAYGLEQPVCENCVCDEELEETKSEGEYVVEEEIEYGVEVAEPLDEDLYNMTGQQLRDIWCYLIGKPTGIKCSGKLRNKKMLIDEIIKLRAAKANETDGVESEDDSDDEDYEPSSESEEEEEEDDLDDEAESEEESEDDGVEGAEPFEDEAEPLEECCADPQCGRATLSLPSSPVPGSDSESEDERIFGCAGCPYEFKQGWKTGYKAAMKELRNYADDQKHNIPDAPECEVCEDSHENLKKCGRCNVVRYCSSECQSEDWPEHKQVCRRR
jgi:hypothetical protein